jgi:superfamily II DNA or RNA helicase
VKPTLRPYQEQGLDATATCLQKGLNRVLLKAPTGTGKTVMFAAMLEHPSIKRWLAQFPPRERHMLVIAHREELLDQAAAKIAAANPTLLVSVEQADRYAHPSAEVVVASIQTLAARHGFRLRRLLAQHPFRIVIVDEAHHAAAATYRTALAHLRFLPLEEVSEEDNAEAATFEDVDKMEQLLRGWDATAPKDRVLVGVTATPNRSDAIGLGCVFQTIAFSYGLREAIQDDWLVPITAWAIDTSDCLDDVRMNRGEFNQKDLAEKVNNAQRNALAVAGWTEHAYNIPTIAFTVDVAHAHDLAEAFTRQGIRAAAVSGETPKDERRETLRRFSEGELEVITNCMILTEGTDLPKAGCILHAKPTKSATLYEQMTGRGLRLHPLDPAGPARSRAREMGVTFRKTECVVIDLVDVARRHSLQTAPILYGLPPKVKGAGQKLEDMADEWDAIRNAHPNVDLDNILEGRTLTLAELSAQAQRVDVWKVPDLGTFAQGRTLRWARLEADAYRIEYPWGEGHETIVVRKDLLDHWQVALSLRLAGSKHAMPERTLAAGVTTADAAAGLAEAFVLQERGSVSRMKATNAGWLARGATPKQLALLARRRVPHNPKTLTAGQASDLIDLLFQRIGRGR